MNVKITGKTLRVNTEMPFDTAGSPPPTKKTRRRKPGKGPKR